MNQKSRFSRERQLELALKSLVDSVAVMKTVHGAVYLAVRAGVIQNFEFTYEMTWKCIKEKCADLGRETKSPRESFQVAFELGLIRDEQVWVDCIRDRNLTTHTYDDQLAERMVHTIEGRYLEAFREILQAVRG